MNWWGKLIGGTFGFLMGGPLGALLGAALGNYFDSGIDSVGLRESLGVGATERIQSAFFTTTFTIMGYVAKSDGQVTRDEIRMAEQVMRQMRLSPAQRKVAINLFNEGKKPDFPRHDVLAQFKREVGQRRTLVQMFLEVVIATAFADAQLHSREQQVLEELAAELGYSQEQFNALLGRLTGQAHFHTQESIASRLKAAYELLGVDARVSDAELKKAYRRQMSQHHPDKLVARGLPEEMMEIATRKTQDIKNAYELIRTHRQSS